MEPIYLSYRCAIQLYHPPAQLSHLQSVSHTCHSPDTPQTISNPLLDMAHCTQVHSQKLQTLPLSPYQYSQRACETPMTPSGLVSLATSFRGLMLQFKWLLNPRSTPCLEFTSLNNVFIRPSQVTLITLCWRSSITPVCAPSPNTNIEKKGRLSFSIILLVPAPVQTGEIPPGVLAADWPRYAGHHGIPEATSVDSHDIDHLIYLCLIPNLSYIIPFDSIVIISEIFHYLLFGRHSSYYLTSVN